MRWYRGMSPSLPECDQPRRQRPHHARGAVPGGSDHQDGQAVINRRRRRPWIPAAAREQIWGRFVRLAMTAPERVAGAVSTCPRQGNSAKPMGHRLGSDPTDGPGALLVVRLPLCADHYQSRPLTINNTITARPQASQVYERSPFTDPLKAPFPGFDGHLVCLTFSSYRRVLPRRPERSDPLAAAGSGTRRAPGGESGIPSPSRIGQQNDDLQPVKLAEFVERPNPSAARRPGERRRQTLGSCNCPGECPPRTTLRGRSHLREYFAGSGARGQDVDLQAWPRPAGCPASRVHRGLDAVIYGPRHLLPRAGAPSWPWPGLQVYVLTSRHYLNTPRCDRRAGWSGALAGSCARGSDGDVHLVGGTADDSGVPRTRRA